EMSTHHNSPEPSTSAGALPKPRELFDLSGRVAVVTGETLGLGLTIPEAFCGEGAEDVVVRRREQACDEVTGELRAAGGRAARYGRPATSCPTRPPRRGSTR